MDHNLTPNPTLSITEGGETETEGNSPNSLTADLVHGMQQCRVMVFKESEEMAKLKQQHVERGFELFRKFAKIVDPAGNWANITVAGVMNFMGRGRRT
ncbi:hypothetical protein ACE6H2_005676 [Prunus campanulata]